MQHLNKFRKYASGCNDLQFTALQFCNALVMQKKLLKENVAFLVKLLVSKV